MSPSPGSRLLEATAASWLRLRPMLFTYELRSDAVLIVAFFSSRNLRRTVARLEDTDPARFVELPETLDGFLAERCRISGIAASLVCSTPGTRRFRAAISSSS